MDPTRNSSPGARLVKTEATPTPADHPSSSTTTKTQSSATTPSDAKKKSSTAAATAAKKPPAGKKPKTLSSAAAAASLPSLKKGGPREAKRLAKAVVNGSPDTAMDDDGSDESDNGPYCLCRGPDDHRWMICCERCDDWFHGECIDLDKGIGESLIEKFVCPNCTTDVVSTIYKKTCALPACRKPARIALGGGTNIPETSSVFCSNDHAHAWWERLVARMPRDRAAAGLSDQLTQDEFMALVASGLAAVGSDGLLKLARMPFQDDDTTALPEVDGDIMTQEEKGYLDGAAAARHQLAQETVLCDHMITLVELAQKRRRAAIDAGRMAEDTCGYDDRLDTISARDAFAAYIRSPAGEAMLTEQHLAPPPRRSDSDASKQGAEGEADDAEMSEEDDDATRGMCLRKRCKAHSGWQKMLVLGVKYQIRELAEQAAEVSDQERVVKEAAAERRRRKQSESNWVEVIE